jgi:hypothetical protein
MPAQLMNLFISLAALIAGFMIGAGFGMVQNAARRRYEKRQTVGKLKSGWAVMPGSAKRVMYLVLTLVLVQIVCPLLFKGGIQWWVSGGVVLGYGLILYRQLRERLSDHK